MKTFFKPIVFLFIGIITFFFPFVVYAETIEDQNSTKARGHSKERLAWPVGHDIPG